MPQQVLAILKSSDVGASADWYRSAGFAVQRIDPTLCEVARAGLVLQFLSDGTPWPGDPALSGCFYVHVADVDVIAEEIRGVIPAEWGVEDRDWGRRELVLRDPDGYFIAFTTPRTSAAVAGRCWCCDEDFAGAQLVHLGARPEVLICLDCAHFLKRRAVAKRDEERWSPMTPIRGGTQRVRDMVIENGWHRRPVIGAVLRSLDRRLP